MKYDLKSYIKQWYWLWKNKQLSDPRLVQGHKTSLSTLDLNKVVEDRK